MSHNLLPETNPFVQRSTLDHELPDFAAITFEDLEPAAMAGMAQERAEWEAIATNPEPPTIANTLDALELAGQLLDRVEAVFYTLAESIGNERLDALEGKLGPLLAAHDDAFWLDRRIYDRIRAVAEAGIDDPETAWVAQNYLRDFVRSGIDLSEADQTKLRDLNAKISAHEISFGQKVVAGMAAAAVPVPDRARLRGLSEAQISSLAKAAADRDRSGYLVTMQLPSAQGIVASLDERELRRQITEASLSRGGGGDEASDTRPDILALARLRAERAALLGFEHHAAYVAAGATAGTSDAIDSMLASMAAPAMANAAREATRLEQELRQEDPEARLESWDWAYFDQRARLADLDIDEDELRPFLELDRVVRDGVFYAAEKLYGLTFKLREDLVGYAPSVKVYEVFDDGGASVGLFVADYFAREGKRGGAWMHNLREASSLLSTTPVVVNNLNIAQPESGPTLLDWDEVTTCFHEFGHALHSLLAKAKYPSVSGTNVPRDFVEYPSQVNEMWAWNPLVLEHFARHYQTGEVMPAELRQKLVESRSWGEGFATTEYLAAALLDQAWHHLRADDVPTGAHAVTEFEKSALTAAGLLDERIPPRYRSTYFNHTFGGGYDAGYYSYIWSEVLDADTVEWFKTEAASGDDGGLNRQAGARFAEALLSRGFTRDPLASYRDLRGRDADITPLLKRRGLTQ